MSAYRTYGSAEYRYSGRAKLAEVSGTGIKFVPSDYNGVVGMVLRPYRKNTDTPGIVVKGIPVPGASVSNSYRTNRSDGY